MTAVAISRLSSKGRITLPQRIRESLDVREGEQLTFQEIARGVVVLSKAPTPRSETAESLLNSLVLDMGSHAERLGLYEEEDLDSLVETIREETYHKIYG